MTAVAWAAGVLVLAAFAVAGMAAARIVHGPHQADRVVALDLLLAAGVALCIAASLLSGRTVYLDVAIGLALVGFVATLGWARLVERSAAARDAGRGGEAP